MNEPTPLHYAPLPGPYRAYCGSESKRCTRMPQFITCPTCREHQTAAEVYARIIGAAQGQGR